MYGYRETGEIKTILFLEIAGAVSAAGIAMLIKSAASDSSSLMKQKLLPRPDKRLLRRYLPELLVTAYLAVYILSWLFSMDRGVSLTGMRGWRTALLFHVFIFVIYLLYVYGWNPPKKYSALALSGSAAAMVLTLFNRFGGMLSVLIPAAMVFYVHDSGRTMMEKAAASLYLLLSFMTLLCLGSEAILVSTAVAFAALFLLSIKDPKKRLRFFSMTGMLGAAMAFLYVLHSVLHLESTANPYSASIQLMERPVFLPILLLSAAAFCIARRSSMEQEDRQEKFLPLLFTFGILLVPALPAAAALLHPFPESFGNGRGFIWGIFAADFKSLPIWRKVIGAGPDCFFTCSMSIPGIKDLLTARYGDLLLTNAHNVIMTDLINTGILGALCELALYGAFMHRCLKGRSACAESRRSKGADSSSFAQAANGDGDGALYTAGILCLLSYAAYHMLSFEQVLSVPFLYLLMGIIGRKYLSSEDIAD